MGKLSVLIGFCALLVACNGQKEPAQAAFAQVQASVGPVSADLEKYAPDEYAELTALIDGMKSKLNAKDYDGALAARTQVMNKLVVVSGAAGKRKNELSKQLTGEWRELVVAVPALLAQVDSRVKSLQGATKLPADVGADALQQAKQTMPNLAIEWTAAGEAVRRRDFDTAVTKAREIKKRAVELGVSLGMKSLT